jgi:hypothetical protein
MCPLTIYLKHALHLSIFLTLTLTLTPLHLRSRGRWNGKLRTTSPETSCLPWSRTEGQFESRFQEQSRRHYGPAPCPNVEERERYNKGADAQGIGGEE